MPTAPPPVCAERDQEKLLMSFLESKHYKTNHFWQRTEQKSDRDPNGHDLTTLAQAVVRVEGVFSFLQLCLVSLVGKKWPSSPLKAK